MLDCCFCPWCCADAPWTPRFKYYPSPATEQWGPQAHIIAPGVADCVVDFPPHQGSWFGSSSLAFIASLPASQEPSEINHLCAFLSGPPSLRLHPRKSSFSTTPAGISLGSTTTQSFQGLGVPALALILMYAFSVFGGHKNRWRGSRNSSSKGRTQD